MANRHFPNQRFPPNHPFENMSSGRQRQIPCPRGCDHGYIHYLGKIPCPYCAGIGRNPHSKLLSEPCSKCHGSKLVDKPSERCGVCGGRGFLLN
jgi:hypothetical protein